MFYQDKKVNSVKIKKIEEEFHKKVQDIFHESEEVDPGVKAACFLIMGAVASRMIYSEEEAKDFVRDIIKTAFSVELPDES